jgi:predicted HD phosphohydrolase
MLTADRRHGLDVAASLRAAGATDADLLIAGLLHDCGKGRRLHLLHRVAWSLGQRYGAWVWRVSGALPTFGTALQQLRDHAERSAQLAEQAGCSPRTVELIRHQDEPTDEAGRLLHEADESN